MESLRILKRPVSIDATLLDGTRHRFEVFLGESSADHAGFERLSELLVRRETFIPAVDESNAGLTWLNTANVVLVRAPAAVDPTPDVETLPTEHEIELRLATGAKLKGIVSYVRPDAYSRITDFLNQDASPFLRLVDGETVVFVNKRHVISVSAGER